MSAVIELDEILKPLSRCFDAESSRRLPELSVAPHVEKRMSALAERANEDLLTEDERAEYEALINATDFLSTLKSKARRHLNSNIK